jgi:hypothetical protein
MTSAEPAGGHAVRTTANLNGQTVEGEARFRVDDAAPPHRMGSEGPNNYSGWLRADHGEGGNSITRCTSSEGDARSTTRASPSMITLT